MDDLMKGYYEAPRWSGELLDCSMPMTFDTYSNCAFNCMYCFSFFQRAVGDTAEAYLSNKVKAVNIEHIKRMFTDPDNHGGQFASYIKHRIPMQWGGLSDGFDYYERKFGKSLELLTFFNSINYPLSISTKGTWFVDDPRYIAQIEGRENIHWKVSIITLDEKVAHKIEAGVPTPMERFETLRKLSAFSGGKTTLRFRPFIIGVSDDYIEQMCELAADSKCYSVTTEFMCIESRASGTAAARFEKIGDVIGYDLLDYYSENSVRSSGLMRLNYELKRPYIERFKKACKANGLKFFVSDCHLKGQSEHASCCGMPPVGELANYSKGQFTHAMMIAKQKGWVRWNDIADEAAKILKPIPFYQAAGFNANTRLRAMRRYQSMFDYMRMIWDNPESWQSPARYFGGELVPAGTDEDGDIIYLYNRPFVEDGYQVDSVLELSERLGITKVDKIEDIPIYVISKGRHVRGCTTPKLLESNQLPYTLWVHQSEEDEYRKAFPNAKIYVFVEANNKELPSCRQEILTHARSQGHKWVWMLDDDIKNIIDSNPAAEVYQNKEVNIAYMLHEIAEVATKYCNVALASPDTFHLDIPNKLWSHNTEGISKCVLVRTDTTVNFKTDSDWYLYSWLVFQLRHLVTGEWSTLTDNRYQIVSPEMLQGGTSPYYWDGHGTMNNRAIKEIHEMYKEYTKIEKKTNKKNKLKVNWNEFATAPIPYGIDKIGGLERS